MNRRSDSQLIQQLVQSKLCGAFKRLLLIFADFTKENSKLKILPNRQHVDNACQLHHELRGHVKGIIVGWIEDIDGPQVDVLDVIRSETEIFSIFQIRESWFYLLCNRRFVQTMEMTTQTNVLPHS